jgi:elongation factor Ts
VVEVNSETDFVARNDLFQGLVLMIADRVLVVGTDVETIKKAKVGDNSTVENAIAETIAKIGENMSLRRAASLSVKDGAIGSYVHNMVSEGLGKIGVLVGLESTGKTDELVRIGKNVAMHIAWANPQALDQANLDPEIIRREKDVLTEKAKAQGKPANVIDKIVESGLKTFYKEVCLLDQAFVHDAAKSVAQAVKEAEAAAGAPIKITGYVRYALGEGIDRPDTDFAAEVAATMKPN